MKRNAIIRIVLWSIALVVLLSILFTVLYVPGALRKGQDNPVEETMVPIRLPLVTNSENSNAIVTGDVDVHSTPDISADPVAFAERGTMIQILRTELIGSMEWGYISAPNLGWIDMSYVQLLEPVVEETETAVKPLEQYNAVVSADALNVRTMPSIMSPTAGKVEKGDHLLITRQETVDGIAWGYTHAPVNGWVVMEYVELLAPTDVEITTMETTATPEPEITGYGVALDAASIREIEIEWAAGSIRIQPKDITEIRIAEKGVNQSEKPMVWKVRDGKLAIQFAENMKISLGMGLNWGDFSKELIIEVPADWQCNSLEVTAAVASLEVSNLTIREMEFDGASGTCVFDNCNVEKLDLDTASGDVRFTGSLQQLDCDAASADIVLELTNVPRSLDMDTASGDLDVTLPADAGFTVSMDTMSGDFDSDFETTSRNGSHVAGNGRCRIDVDGMSGNVNIRKGQ